VTTTFELRAYQKEQLDALYRWWTHHDAIKEPPIIVAPTGAGKSFTIAMIVDRLWEAWGTEKPRTVVVVPSKELAQQNADKLATVLPPHISIGYYSASLGRKNARADVVVATIGSIYKDAHLLGGIRCVIIDECHLVNPGGEGRYRRFLNDLALHTQFAVVGLTATPFRGNGVWLTQGEDPLFCGICHETKIGDLIRDGYLAPLSLPEGGLRTRINTDDVAVTSTGDYAVGELEDVVAEAVQSVADESVRLAADRQRVIAFTPTVATAEALSAALAARGWSSSVVCGSTPKDLRARRIAGFRSGHVRCLVTVLALATGFDVPDIDAIIWARPSRSPVLYIQGAGRGLRTAPGKMDCLWLDFTDTTDRLGPIDEVSGRDKSRKAGGDAPFTYCPECHAEVRPASLLECPHCGAHLRDEMSPFKAASDAPVLSMHRPGGIESLEVDNACYYRHTKPGSPDSIRVAYMAGLKVVAQEWVCPEHGGWAASKAVSWLMRHAVDTQAVRGALLQEQSIAPLLDIANAGGLRAPKRIRVSHAGKYPQVIGHEFDDREDAA
jgi:DNA repair protein RadD